MTERTQRIHAARIKRRDFMAGALSSAAALWAAGCGASGGDSLELRVVEAPPPVLVDVDTFVGRGADRPGLPSATAAVGYNKPRAIRYVGEHDRTYISYGDAVCNPVITFFDHRARRWATPVKIGQTGVPDNAHGLPSIVFDQQGRLYAFYGSHGGAHFMRRCGEPESIDSWGPVLTPSPNATYGRVFFVGETLHWYHREHRQGEFARPDWLVEVPDRSPQGLGLTWGIRKSTDGGLTWSELQVVAPSFSDGLFYPIMEVGPERLVPSLHVAWLLRLFEPDRWSNIYYAVSYDLGRSWQTSTGESLGSELRPGEGELIHEGSNRGWNQQIILDPETREPGILWVTGGAELKQDNAVMFASLRDRRWRVSKVCDATSRYASGVVVAKARDRYRIYVTTGLWNGGEVVEYETQDGGASWTRGRDITEDSPAPHNRPLPIVNASPEMQIFWSSGDAEKRGELYVWGEAGPVPASARFKSQKSSLSA